MSVASEITRLQNAKSALKTSINAKTDNEHQIDDETLDNYAEFVDSIQTGGSTPTIGYVVNSFNNDGYPTEITTYGFTIMPNKYFSTSYSTNDTSFQNVINISLNNGVTRTGTATFQNCTNLILVNLPNTLENIGNFAFSKCTNLSLTSLPNSVIYINASAFQNCTNLALTSLPSSLTSIGNTAFYNCTKLAIKTIPDGVTKLDTLIFYNCTQLKKISMNNVTQISGNQTSNGTFGYCTGLKQVWIGSAITSNSFARYAFNGCSNLEKMYINLPRATIEGFTNYQYAFMNDTSKTGIIVCNDDEGFISKAEFDALVVE